MVRFVGLWLFATGCALQSNALAPEDIAPKDAAIGDGAADTAMGDSGRVDGTMDGALADAADAAPPDAVMDAAPSDSSPADTAPADTGRPDALAACPAGYSRMLGDSRSCYRVVGTARTWQNAERDCESVGAHLIVVNDRAEDDLVPDYHWLGFSETVSDGDWRWVTGIRDSGFRGWATGEPAFGGAACAVQRPDGWHDDNDYEAKPYVCEHDGVMADAAAWE